MKIKLAKSEIIHFIGIGGIGMSGLSLIMKGKGFRVQGSDIASNKNIERLKKEKIKIIIGQKKQNINKATIIVISSAIKKNNPELMEAKKKQLPIYKRGEMLANIVSLTKNIVVVGSHGKTTTTSLVASIFQETKIDPTVINGGVSRNLTHSWLGHFANGETSFFKLFFTDPSQKIRLIFILISSLPELRWRILIFPSYTVMTRGECRKTMVFRVVK